MAYGCQIPTVFYSNFMERKTEELVKDGIARCMNRKPKMISLKLTRDDLSEIRIAGEGWDESVNHLFTISFTSFMRQVVEGYEEVYGKLTVLARSFREEIYENEKISGRLSYWRNWYF